MCVSICFQNVGSRTNFRFFLEKQELKKKREKKQKKKKKKNKEEKKKKRGQIVNHVIR